MIKIIDPKDAINRRQDEGLIIVKTAIYRVSRLNGTVLHAVRAIHELPPPENNDFGYCLGKS